MRDRASLFSLLCALTAIPLLIALNGCAIVVHKDRAWHHAGIGVRTSPSVCIRIGYWYTIPMHESTRNDCRKCLHH